MSHVIGRRSYARETYPGRGNAGGQAVNDVLRFYGGATAASVPQTTWAATVTGDTIWVDFTQDNILQAGAKVVSPIAYHLTSFDVKRVITGGAGPIIGDTDVLFELLQSIDNGATWTNPGGGGALSLTFAPNETGDKSLALDVVVPVDALLTVRATYPTNYDPQGQDEVVLPTVAVG